MSEYSAEKGSPVRKAWLDASAFGTWPHPDYPPAKSRTYRIAVRVFDALRGSVVERWAATKMLVRPDTRDAVYVADRYRLKALILLWLLPIRWNYPDWKECPSCDQVCGYNESRFSGYEYDSWEATFVAIPMGLRLGRAHIYRDGGP